MAKSYPVGLAGESNYQAAINRCATGERVYIAEEIGNPHDSAALAVERSGGAVIGYLPRDSWLREVVHEGRSTRATIKQIASGGSGLLGVVLDVVLDVGSAPRVRQWKGANATRAKSASRAAGKQAGSTFAKLLKGLSSRPVSKRKRARVSSRPSSTVSQGA